MERHSRWFRRLLRILPADFQADYARDMERTFRAQHGEAARDRGMRGVVDLWIETLRDLLRTAPREHFDQIRQDVAYALRHMRQRPAGTLAAVATLAIGIGGVTAIVSVVNGVDWRPLGYPDANRVVYVKERYQGTASTTTGFATFTDWRERSRSFTELAAVSGIATTILADEGARQVLGMRVTPGFFRVIGVEPMLGRAFTEADNRWDNRRFVVLSAPLWRNRFQSDPRIAGRAIQLGGVPYVVRGVMPDNLEDLIGDQLYDRTEIWTPLGYNPTLPFACRTCRHLRVFGRLRPDVTREAAEAELQAITQQLAREHAGYAQPGAAVERVADALVGPIRPALYLLLAAVAVLLAIAAVNVANLLLARSVERSGEIATRRALGVASGRLVRQLLTESLALAAAGAACGILLGHAALRSLIAAAPAGVPRIADVTIDARVLALTAGVTCAVGILFGMLPAWHLMRVDIVSALRGARASGAGGRSGRLLVAGNVVLAVVLLAVTALLGRSLVHLLRVDPGFDPQGVTVASLSLAGPAYAEQAASLAFYRTLLDGVRRVGDVAALTTQLPLELNDRAGFHVVGRFTPNPEDAPMADRFAVTPDYFRALRIPLRHGRALAESDGAASPPVAIINETAARELFGGDDPVGQRILLGGRSGDPRLVVGVVADVRHRGLSEPISYQAYVPLPQYDDAPVRLVLRTGDDAVATATRIRTAVASVDRTQAVSEIRPLATFVADTLAERRFLLWLIGVFAAMALSLCVVGLYGVVSYAVAQRMRDIGVRVAFGAAARDVRRFVLGIGMTPVLFGLAAGLPLLALVTRAIEPMLVPVGRLDVVAIVSAAAVLLAGAALACYIPARRAARVDPVTALRTE